MPSMSGRSRVGRAWLAAGDAAVGIGALYLAFQVRFAMRLPAAQDLLPLDRFRFFEGLVAWVVVAQLAALWFFGLYDDGGRRARSDLARSLAIAIAVAAMGLAAALFLANRTFPRSVLVVFGPLDAALLFLWRDLSARLRPSEARRVALVGVGPGAREVAGNLARHRWHGLVVVAHLPAPGEVAVDDADAERAALGRRLASLDELATLFARGEIDDVILAPAADSWQTRWVARLIGARPQHANLLLLPGPFESLIGKMRYRWVNDLPLIEVAREAEPLSGRFGKRLIDTAGAALLLALAAPALVAAAFAIRLSSPGPVFYCQIRIGRERVPFSLWKLRTMRVGAEAEGAEALAAPDDPRLTPIGGLLRRMRLDELPQLLNVLAGQMSLVGPRPERPGFVARYLDEVPGYVERFSVLPGVTGLAQVNGEYHSSAENKLRYDLAYIANQSLWLDLSILVRTVKTVLTSRGI